MRRGVVAEFGSAQELLHAVEALRARRYTCLETYAPYDLPHVDRLVQRRRSRLPAVVLLGGVGGGAAAYGLQWYTTARNYPLNVGGRPLNSVPAFLASTVESILLVAALAAFVGLLVVLGLPEPWHPVFEIDGFERASDDRFWIGIDARDPQFHAGQSTQVLEALHPIRVAALPENVPALPALPHWVRWLLGRP